jgi:hypothetical protein
MIVIQLAGIRVRLENRFPFIEYQCKDFLCEGDEFEFSVSVTPEEILEEQKFGAFSDGYCESICLYRHICEKMPEYNVFLMHSSVIEVDGYAYAFTAKSGVGKSTHTKLWQSTFGEKVKIFNDDKPALRRLEDGWFAYGTPWCGKDGININMKVPLGGICFLKQSTENSIRRLDKKEAIQKILSQTTTKIGNVVKMDKLLQTGGNQ